MKYYHKKRLLKLADFLENLPRENFDLDTWWSPAQSHVNNFTKFKKNPHFCGTTACAAGWACTIPSFKRAGLTVKTTSIAGQFEPAFKKYRAFSALEDFFGIDDYQARQLFESGYYMFPHDGPRNVSNRIRKLVKTGRAL